MALSIGAFDNSYARLPERFYASVAPAHVADPQLVMLNRPLAEELGLPPHVVAAFGLVVGWPDPAGAGSVTPRLPQDVVLHRERYDLDGQRDQVRAYDRLLADFYADEGLGGRWTDRIAARFGSVEGLRGRHLLRQALRERGFRLR